MKKKIKVLCIPSNRDGVGLFRSLAPHLKLDEMYDDKFDVNIVYDIDWSSKEEISKYDIIHFHQGIYDDMEEFENTIRYCKEQGCKIVMDIDDFWEVGTLHPLFNIRREYNITKIIQNNMKLADYVTTTTQKFADKIKKFNPNVKVFPNALDYDEISDIIDKKPSDKIRFGFVMGYSHEEDMELFRGTVNKLPKSILDKIQFVLCGFDTRDVEKYVNGDGKISERPISPTETVWYKYEVNVTDNYKIVSDEYEKFLKKFKKGEYENEENEPYVRKWTKTVKEYDYLKHYNDIDVLLVPLKDNSFNECKSELKFVEAGMTNTAVIASNFGPYTIGSKNLLGKGGKILKSGNCILIDNHKAHKMWAKAIEFLVNNPNYINVLKTNLNTHIMKNYDLKNITTERAKWYNKIVK